LLSLRRLRWIGPQVAFPLAPPALAAAAAIALPEMPLPFLSRPPVLAPGHRFDQLIFMQTLLLFLLLLLHKLSWRLFAWQAFILSYLKSAQWAKQGLPQLIL
jgi:hypothetical protein